MAVRAVLHDLVGLGDAPVLPQMLDLSTMSVNAPATTANRNIGRLVATCTSETSSGSVVSSVISHAAAALYIHPPMFETTLAVQTTA
jgi:hypothetical protein